MANTIEAAKDRIREIEGQEPYIVVTGANFTEDSGDENVLRDKLQLDNRPMFLLFGTGWGLHASVTDSADFKLNPILGAAKDGYNHLSVRSAVAIYCDRIHRSL